MKQREMVKGGREGHGRRKTIRKRSRREWSSTRKIKRVIKLSQAGIKGKKHRGMVEGEKGDQGRIKMKRAISRWKWSSTRKRIRKERLSETE